MTKRNLTENQQKFLDALFGDAKGNPALAIRMAGYAESTSTREVVDSLKHEILEQANLILAMNAPAAALQLVGVMVEPGQANATIKLKAIESLLDRTGVNKSKDANQDVNLKVPSGGLFIMPAKDALHQDERSSEDVIKEEGAQND